jgi:hypothetical protein
LLVPTLVDEVPAAAVGLGWVEVVDDVSGGSYYWHQGTDETSWGCSAELKKNESTTTTTTTTTVAAEETTAVSIPCEILML